MERNYVEDQTFEKMDFTQGKWERADFDNCSFLHCNLSPTDLSGTSFSDCRFLDCNLSLAKIAGTSFKTVLFKDCKMLGMHFEDCDPFLFSVNFDNCILKLSCFYKRNLKKTMFKDSNLQEVDFSQSDLTHAIFDHCDLHAAVFNGSNLERSDFRSSNHFSIDPSLNKIRKARFSLATVGGLLDKYDLDLS